jgi:hypothetical protein
LRRGGTEGRDRGKGHQGEVQKRGESFHCLSPE